MKRFFKACVALVLAWALVLGAWSIWQGRAPAESVFAPSIPAEPAPVLAFFGASTEPWCENLRQRSAEWCEETGWALVEYDCLGLDDTRALQVDDLLRSGGAELAVLCALGDQESLNAQAAALAEGGVAVLTVSDTPLDRPQNALCHLGPDREGLWNAASAFFRQAGAETGVVILRDTAAEGLESEAWGALASTGVTVLEEAYTWGSVGYAQDFMLDILGRQDGARGVLCFSRTGARGAWAALEEAGRQGQVKLLCLDGSQRLMDDLARFELDGLVTLNPRAAAEGLAVALTQAAEGKAPVGEVLPLEIYRAED